MGIYHIICNWVGHGYRKISWSHQPSTNASIRGLQAYCTDAKLYDDVSNLDDDEALEVHAVNDKESSSVKKKPLGKKLDHNGERTIAKE